MAYFPRGREDQGHIHDPNATILRTLGIGREKLAFRSQGRDFGLTELHGRVVNEIVA